MHTASWRGMALPILCLALSACGQSDAKAKADPNAPAVIKAPAPIVASDTAKIVVPPVVEMRVAQTTVSSAYALLGAGLVLKDPKLVRAAYAPAAELTTPNGTFTGPAAILKEFQSFTSDGSLKDFARQSSVMKVIDSTVADSGVYQVTRAKGSVSTSLQGPYASLWRIHPAPMQWVMLKDHLYPTSKKSGK